MARNDVVCPICSADIPLSGDERNGDEIFCTVCSAPCKLSGDPASDDCEAEEDDM
jgi:hypothetical protein